MWGLAQTTGTLGAISRDEGDAPGALALVRESATLAREAGSPWWESGALAELAWLLLDDEQVEEGETRARESLAIARQLRDRAGRVFGVGLLARVAIERGQGERAGHLWGAIEDDDAGAPLGGWRRHRDDFARRVHELAGPDFARGYAIGRELALDDAVASALE